MGTAKEFGFKLRKGNGKELIFKYNRETQNMYVDGRNAGYHVNSGNFSYTLKPLDGNKVKLRIIIDQGAVEAFGNDGEANISTAMYQENSNIGMEFFCDDGDVTIDQLKIYDMKSMYTGKSGSESEAPQLYLSAPREAQVHTEFRVDTNMYPNMESGDVVWTLDPGLQLVKEEKGSIVVSGSKEGTYKIKASAQGLEREVEIKLFTSSFASNIPDWNLDGGIWAKTADGVIGSNTGGDSFLIHDTRIYKDKPFIYEADMHILEGTAAGIVFGVSDRNNPSADWFCTNIERKDDGSSIAKLFKNQNGEIWNVTKVIPAKKTKAATQAHLKVVYDGAGKLEYWLDGEKILERSNVDMQDGYLGVQTFRSTTVFNNVNVQYPGASVVSLMEKIPALTIAFGDKTLQDQLPKQILVKLDNDVELLETITWNLEDVNVNKAGVYTLRGKAAGHTIEVKVTVRADKKELQKLLDQAKTYVEKDYTKDSWKAFEAAWYRAAAAYADETATQDDVNSCAAALEKAMQGLEKAVITADKRDLKELVASAKKIKAEGYTANSYAALEKAIAAAEKVLANEKALQSEVDTALKNLKQAVLALEIGQGTANRDQLQNLVSILKTVKKEGYTAASWEAFVKALRQAEAVLANESADEAAITKAYEALQQSYRKLQPVSAGDDEKPQGDGQKEPSKPDAEHPDTGDTTSTGAAGMLTLLAGGAAVVLRRRRKQGKSEN
ncbi:GH32 C-terminal domain-containing protein [[Clostridium] innocuum]|uniref:GH32 C-terminal domain-containing protein n=1 Tax=Clostridium innocuum TaxID=1522 RepID=UPI001F560E45|nr:GH32 C-terminal domain-containing protein [[Clostridium] innocuum]MCI3010839.1 GH32 C-terminal domain-containing protein [[Clostridium] innocuum]MCR0298178.1 GH32 C-terminal domain-containing protein [[Clostridium] innocuum]MCR0316186.1 GH32 C-terminal domain-containing protein [[Clostridium] innocuum]MCR0344556.1 GH32 C-terminal domain-containing protein [[Clostridium] innocuum]MCR0401951.1 GH32 C-terminal domain-containing protein [[Clostridium] innocuum]